MLRYVWKMCSCTSTNTPFSVTIMSNNYSIHRQLTWLVITEVWNESFALLHKAASLRRTSYLSSSSVTRHIFHCWVWYRALSLHYACIWRLVIILIHHKSFISFANLTVNAIPFWMWETSHRPATLPAAIIIIPLHLPLNELVFYINLIQST